MANVDLLGVIQMIVQENLKGQKLADKMTGTVVSVSPLSVQPDISMPPIPEAGADLNGCGQGKDRCGKRRRRRYSGSGFRACGRG